MDIKLVPTYMQMVPPVITINICRSAAILVPPPASRAIHVTGKAAMLSRDIQSRQLVQVEYVFNVEVANDKNSYRATLYRLIVPTFLRTGFASDTRHPKFPLRGQSLT